MSKSKITTDFKRIAKAHTPLNGVPAHVGFSAVYSNSEFTVALVAPDMEQLDAAWNHMRGNVLKLDRSMAQKVAMFSAKHVVDIGEEEG
jgi:hypothetical protein